MNQTNKEKIVKKILIKVKPEIKSIINKKKINLLDDGFIDSFDILRIIVEIEKIQKKIDAKKVHRKTFSTIGKITKLLK